MQRITAPCPPPGGTSELLGDADFDAAVKSRFARGHVEVRVSLPKAESAAAPALNTALLDGYLRAFEEVASKLGSTEPLNERFVGSLDQATALALEVVLARPGFRERAR